LPLELGDRLAIGKRVRHGLPIEFIQLRFEVEGLEMRRATGHAKKDDSFDLGFVMGES
jgi:hypothetical protein